HSSKQVPRFGKFRLPVEVILFAETVIRKRIAALGANVKLRQYAYGNPFTTDEGHHILDCSFGEISDPPALDRELKSMAGVVDHGLFINIRSEERRVGKEIKYRSYGYHERKNRRAQWRV